MNIRSLMILSIFVTLSAAVEGILPFESFHVATGFFVGAAFAVNSGAGYMMTAYLFLTWFLFNIRFYLSGIFTSFAGIMPYFMSLGVVMHSDLILLRSSWSQVGIFRDYNIGISTYFVPFIAPTGLFVLSIIFESISIWAAARVAYRLFSGINRKRGLWVTEC